jgi:hypothetical protein
MTDKCMKYYYPDKDDVDNLNLSCSPRNFDNIDNNNFTNQDMLEFIDKNYAEPIPENNPFTFSEDYIDQEYTELCSTSSYSLKPQQKFIGQLVNPNSNIKNLLIYHGLGSGKTCTSLLIGEAFSNVKNKETIYVVPAALEQQYLDEIIGEIKNRSIQSCTSMCLVYDNVESKYLRSFYTSVDGKMLLDQTKAKLSRAYADKKRLQDELVDGDKKEDKTKQLDKIVNNIRKLEYNIKIKEDQILSKVSKVFTITTHEKFINRLMKITDSKQIILKEYLQTGSSLFNDSTTLIIDEIQNLISAGGIRYKILYNSIKYYINKNVRKVFLSATPIYDNAFELALTMNLLMPRAPFPTKPELFYNMFVGKIVEKDDRLVCEQRDISERLDYFNSCMINQELFKYMCSGYVSYFKGGNPVAYPYKRIIEIYHPMEDIHKKHYVNSLRKDLVQDLYRTIGRLNKGSSTGNYEGIIINEHSESEASGTLTHARQAINVAFQAASLYSEADELAESDLTESEKTKLVIKQNKQLIKRELTGSYDEIMAKLGKISSKIRSIIEISLSVEGTIFIYSNWLGYGVEAISAVLDAMGYSRFPKSGESYKSYFVWSPSVESDKDVIKKARQTFNSPDNADGKLIKFMLGTSSIKEGVSFKNLKQIHLLDPWWNNSRIEQIIARGFRLCSHVDVSPENRYTDVFKHVGILPTYYDEMEDEDVSRMFDDVYDEFRSKSNIRKEDIPADIDPAVRSILSKSNKNVITEALKIVFSSLDWTKYVSIDQKIISVANDKTSLNNKFERQLKSVGVDCELFKNGNLIRLEENVKQISKNEYQIYYKNPSTLVNYMRESVPEIVSFNDILSRKYSYPNSADLPIKFTRADFEDDKFTVKADETDILDDSVLTKDLVMNENIECWNSDFKFEDIPVTDIQFKNYTRNKSKVNDLMDKIRVQFLGQLRDTATSIKFSDNDRLKRLRIIECYKRILADKTLDNSIRIKIQQYTGIFKEFEDLDKKIMAIAAKLSLTKESDIKNLYTLAINNRQAIERQYQLLSS